MLVLVTGPPAAGKTTVSALLATELRRRYRRRAEQRRGRRGHFDLERREAELWNESSLRPLAGGWPVVTVDTSVEVDVAALAEAVRQASRAGGGQAPSVRPARPRRGPVPEPTRAVRSARQWVLS